MTEQSPAAPPPSAAPVEDDEKPQTKAHPPRIGDMVEYRGNESGGSSEHPAIVTGLNADGSVDVTVFYRRSPPGFLTGLIENSDGLFMAKEP